MNDKREARDSQPPGSSVTGGEAGAGEHPTRRRLEGVVSDLLKRAVEIGVEKAQEAPESLKHLVGDLRLPKEVASYLLSQVEETKNAALRVVAKETREFLEHTNLAHELQKVLTTLRFEVNTTIRFRPNEPRDDDDETGEDHEKLLKPEVKLDVFARKKKRGKEG